MAIQWFPGHMHVTKKAIAERIRQTDVMIELLDARLPGSSANPLLADLTVGKPALKVLNKQDLADPERTAQWLTYYNAQSATCAIALDASAPAPARALIQACHALAPKRGSMARPMRVLICGIPNVGKSTLINTLAGKRAAKTGDEAGITKLEQRIVLSDGFYLYDTPGMLWPRIIVAQSGYHLAASGAIGRNAFDEEEVGLELINSLKEPYAGLLTARYGIANPVGMNDEDLLEAVGRQRGALLGGGRVNRTKAAEIVMQDFRSGALGRITLETPEQFAQWLVAGQVLDAARQLKKDVIEQRRLIKSKQIPRPPKTTDV